jgi:hypothetical protein
MNAATHVESWLPPAIASTADYGRELIPLVRDGVARRAAACLSSVSALVGAAR